MATIQPAICARSTIAKPIRRLIRRRNLTPTSRARTWWKLFDGKCVRAVRNYFDTQGRLQRTVDAKGKETIFTHDIAGRTETIIDRENNTTVHRYDERGNVIETRTPDGTVADKT